MMFERACFGWLLGNAARRHSKESMQVSNAHSATLDFLKEYCHGNSLASCVEIRAFDMRYG